MADTWHVELTWHAGLAQMQRGMQGHVAEPREPTRLVGARKWRRHVAGPRESTRTPGWQHVAGRLAGEGPTGLWALVRVLGH